jgi:hypothetical protein
MVVTAKTLCLAIMANSALYGASSAARACSYSDTIVKEATKNKIDPFIFASMLHVESNWKPHLTSSAGACGIAQVMPQWSKYTCKQLKDPKTGNISVGLCGYNAGFRCKGKNPNRHGVRYAKKVLRIAKKFKRKAK